LALTKTTGPARVDLIDAETLRRTGGFEAFADRPALAIQYSPDGSQRAVAGQGGGVGVWDAGSGKRIGPLLSAPHGARSLRVAEPVEWLVVVPNHLRQTAGFPDRRRKPRLSRAFVEMELAGLEPATSWVRYRVRKPNRGDLSSLGCSKFS
jgi:hypothetical protein